MKLSSFSRTEPSSGPVTRDLAKLTLRRMSGFRGYPADTLGEEPFIEALQSCLTVEHARETVRRFDERFPTLREVRDVIVNLRQQFEPAKPSERAQWEKEYGPPTPAFTQELLRRRDDGSISAIEEGRIMNRRIAEHLKIQFRDFRKISWSVYFTAMRDLGYPMTPEQARYLADR